jgi:hypothetical protein
MWPFSRQKAMKSRRNRKRAGSLENPTIPVSSENFLAYFGINNSLRYRPSRSTRLGGSGGLGGRHVLSRTLAALPLHAYRDSKDGPKQ